MFLPWYIYFVCCPVCYKDLSFHLESRPRTLTPTIQKEYTCICIIVFSSRSIDQDPPYYPFPCLEGEMRVAPGTAILRCSPSVGVR
jgi:hypothetical protein